MPVPAARANRIEVELPKPPKDAKWAEPAKYIDRVVYRADGEGYLPDAFAQVFLVNASGGSARQLTSGDFDTARIAELHARCQASAGQRQPTRGCGL